MTLMCDRITFVEQKVMLLPKAFLHTAENDWIPRGRLAARKRILNLTGLSVVKEPRDSDTISHQTYGHC